jgi:hypothetical protein
MPDPRQSQTPPEVEELTTSIREMASRVSAEFVLDKQKAQSFIAAGEQRDRASSDPPES